MELRSKRSYCRFDTDLECCILFLESAHVDTSNQLNVATTAKIGC